MVRVAVIGAGAAGLAALRRMSQQPSNFTPIAFEKGDQVGGTWLYTEKKGLDDDGFEIHGSMYENLRTNLPKEVMAYPGFPFNKNLASFVMHTDVNQYLNDFADHYNLRQYIKFNTIVERIHPLTSQDGTSWEVSFKEKYDGKCRLITQMFDGVMICNGHYALPRVPVLPGLDVYEGDTVHSHDYRHPEDFAKKIVLCLGTGSSGQDISLDLAPHVKHLYLCSRKPGSRSKLPNNITEKPAISHFTKDRVILEGGEEIAVDVVLWCTGYNYDFSFLTPQCEFSVEDDRLYPLYKHVLHPKLPSLSFIGVCKVIAPFPQFDIQVQFAMAAMTRTMELPSLKEMLTDIEDDYQTRLSEGLPHRYAHIMGHRQWAYNDMLADMAYVERLPPVVERLYKFVSSVRATDLTNYKKHNFLLEDSESFKVNEMTEQ